MAVVVSVDDEEVVAERTELAAAGRLNENDKRSGRFCATLLRDDVQAITLCDHAAATTNEHVMVTRVIVDSEYRRSCRWRMQLVRPAAPRNSPPPDGRCLLVSIKLK